MSTATGLEVIEHLDFTPDHSCEVELRKGGICGDAAVWLAIHGCCGATTEMCARHGARFLALVNGAAKIRGTLSCDYCLARGNDPALYRTVPLT
jgi:hypothetical protein